ncbi:MAG TPA: RNA methyltransferase [Candidatus Paceibacterota bacterium]|nr:RNA methyltransferase [Candidatus Paceibacterota bacterium]
MKTNKLYISGKHAAYEALMYAPQAVKRVYIARGFQDNNINKLIERNGLERLPLSEGESRADIKGNSSSQGIVVQISLIDMLQPFEKFLDTLAVSPSTSLLLLGGVQDPHNVGAIIRSAAAFGVSGVLLPQQNQSPITAAVIKSSAGMAFQIPLVTIPSAQTALAMLKKRGFTAYALAAGKQNIADAAFASPSVLVLGNEGVGLDKAVRALCDETLSIPMHIGAESLNVAASAAIALHSWSERHPEALK